MMKRRERFDAEMANIREALLVLGESCDRRSSRDVAGKNAGSDHNKAKRLTVTSGGLMATAYQLAGYVVATLLLGRSLPERVTLEEAAEYDLGRCSEIDLDTIWAVGNLAVERKRDDGSPGEPGPTVVIVKLESDVGEVFHVQPTGQTMQPEQRAQHILAQSWGEIVHVARLLVEKGTLARAEIEAEVFDRDDATPTAPSSPRWIAPPR
jgi:hypothetical protein